MTQPYFFGYGSLVNTATHDYGRARPARLLGWRRAWRHTDLRPVAFLTAVPAPGHAIDGLIAHVPGGDWTALDLREHAYDRIPATASVQHDLSEPAEIAVYAIPDHAQTAASLRHPVLLSYVDVVVQGYRQQFGAQGVADFFATTDGWEAPILDDRAAPRYPRAQRLDRADQLLVDHHLAAVGARILSQT